VKRQSSNQIAPIAWQLCDRQPKGTLKGIILAAEQGTRLRSLHGELPKCLTTFNNSDWTILDQQIHNLLLAGVREIGIVIGYQKDQVIRHVTQHYTGLLNRFNFIDNPRFRERNNIYSLWLARNWLKRSSFVVLNADVVFDAGILPPALASTAPITVVVDRSWRGETMKVIIQGSWITRMGRQMPEEVASASYIGIAVFQAGTSDRFFEKIYHLIQNGQNQVCFNVGIQQLIEEGIPVGYTEATDHLWTEVDDPGDLALARLYIFPKLVATPAAA